jgi:hypothetical protein
VIRKQAALRRGHLPLRRLLDQTADVLFALKPCWAIPPLMVSQVLPLTRLFDLVIFDEGTVPLGAGFESTLDALRPLLPTCPLNWHYRRRDERLVAFSNDRIYGGALTTFPGVARRDCLRHVVVAQDPGPGQESSVGAEVTEVVRLVLEHARTRPKESLGVIALGMRQAERIDAAVRTALSRAGLASLESFFAEDLPSRSSSRTWSGCRATIPGPAAPAPVPDDPAPPPEPVPDRASVAPPGPETPLTRPETPLASAVPPGSNGSPALETRRGPIALPAGDPVPARGLPTSSG